MASYLMDIAMLWWQPHLIAQLEPSIHSNWSKCVVELNNLFGHPISHRPLNVLSCTQNARLPACSTSTLIEFSEHATHTGWNDVALYGEFYRGPAECIKDHSFLWIA